MSFRIMGTGMYVPSRIVTNDELSEIVDTSDEWISKRVGVRERRISESEFPSEMGAKAARAALADAGCDAADLDMILSASVSAETVSPSTACMIQHALGVTCPVMEINAACAAFLYMLETAAAYFALHKDYRKILVVGCERISGILDWSDRSTCVIFGDGAGAAVLERGEGYLDSVCHVHGGDDVIKIPHTLGSSPFFHREQDSPYIHMKGQETFKYAVNAIEQDIRILLERNHLSMEDIAWIVPHQANRRIMDFACKRLGIDPARMVENIDRYGNTSSASIPIALHELKESGRLRRGDKMIFVAFGGGLSDMACLLEY